ncbi:FecR domain-containing protein [Paracoccus denitrificans]|jgi:transmembrane sensor|uniref:Putative FecR n=1 Tax=Paracoccus denitrificans (strain Pd 1222) TaxID=318586 RepID=A1BCE6_PARDP|nr:FecR family protein [Paracoccus denitrificans]ABL73190.1 putative FecR [Paracoccus denitrificans PD1222]MBB4628672.1 transmembrane sensor [Paracoccus denitrificans]MCU7429728.1 FecR family protein [Paracoccus denitrificans]QAR29566.1 FecR family protein [Paracoccus denitrificans]UPV98663.1 FecR family protein [Paracoccus denitrificans]
MSGPPRAELLEEAADWAMAMRYGAPGEVDGAAFERWLAQSPQHAAAWQRAQAVFQTFERVPRGLGKDVLRAMEPLPGRRRALGVLGGALLVPSAGVMAWQQPWQKWGADVATAVGERRALALPDASQLVLNTDSAADIAFTTAERRIHLRAGEILLTTHPDPAPVPRPLLVETAFGEVRALGTRFSVRQLDGDLVRVSVFRHAVEIRPRNAAPHVLHQGEQADFDSNGVRPPATVDESAAIWEQGMLLAQDMRLGDVIAEMARHRRGVLRCDPAVAAILVSGAISLSDTDGGLALLERTLPVRIQRRTPWWVVVAPRS